MTFVLRAAAWIGAVVLAFPVPATARFVGTEQTRTYTNPVLDVSAPDPHVIALDDGSFLAYTTQRLEGDTRINIPVWSSPDLLGWSGGGDALPTLPGWAMTGERADTWAPHVIRHRGRYQMYFAARTASGPMAIGVAIASDPRGPFTPDDAPVVVGRRFAAIDPFVLRRADALFLVWGSAEQPLRAQRLSAGGRRVVGEARVLLRPRPDLPYERLIEGAWVVRRRGLHYLFYSGDRCCGDEPHYAVMVARSRRPFGPYRRNPRNPVLAANASFTAPGHNSTIRDDLGHVWMLYHAVSTTDPAARRVLLLDRVRWERGWPMINDGDGPSSSSRRAPVTEEQP